VSILHSLLLSLFRRLLSWEEGIGNAFDIQDERAAGEHPLLRSVGSLELGREHIRLVSVSRHIDWALVDALLFLAFYDHLSCAVDEWHNRELLLGDRFLDLASVLVPGGAFQLETEDVGSVFAACKNVNNLGVPVELLLDVSLDIELIKTLASLLSAHLLNGGQERVWLVESVKEANSLVDDGRVILPHI